MNDRKTDPGIDVRIDDYIAQFPPATREKLHQLRRVIRQSAPFATEKISYQMPTFYFHSNLVHFAAYQKHIGFYPTPSAILAFQEELSVYQTSKGAIQFPLDQPIPEDLVRRIVLFRVEENQRRAMDRGKNKA